MQGPNNDRTFNQQQPYNPENVFMENRHSHYHVKMHDNLQPVHNKLRLSIEWNSIFFNLSVQGVPVPHFAESFGKRHSFQKLDWSHRRLRPVWFLFCLENIKVFLISKLIVTLFMSKL